MPANDARGEHLPATAGGTFPNRPPVFTVGHGTLDFATLQSLLEPHRVTTLVDVRSEPYSRRAPDFTKRRLEELSRVAGLGYRWMGDRLGGRPSSPGLQTATGDPDFDRIAADPAFTAAIEELGRLGRAGRVVVLCAESNPDDCHRSRLIAPRLEDQGFAVYHLLHDGRWHRHQADLFGSTST